MFKMAMLGIAAFFCMAGQVPRKEVQEVPSTQCVTNEVELQKESAKKSNGRKGAAKRVVEESEPTAMNRKSAAKRSMEFEE